MTAHRSQTWAWNTPPALRSPAPPHGAGLDSGITGLCHTEKVTFRDKLFGARLYVLAFAICLVAPAVLLVVARPHIAFSDHWPPSPTRVATTLIVWLVLGASCLVAALGIKSRVARWLAAFVLSVAVLRYGYRSLYLLAVMSLSESLFLIAMSFSFLVGPLCVGIWLCFPRFHPRSHQPRPGRVSPSCVER